MLEYRLKLGVPIFIKKPSILKVVKVTFSQKGTPTIRVELYSKPIEETHEDNKIIQR